MSSSAISAVGRLTLTLLKSASSIVGYTSKVAVNSKSMPGSILTTSSLGDPAGFISSCCTACTKLLCISSPATSARTALPYRLRTSFRGTLPTRKPGIFTLPRASCRRWVICDSNSSLAIAMVKRRSKPVIVSMDTFMMSYQALLLDGKRRRGFSARPK